MEETDIDPQVEAMRKPSPVVIAGYLLVPPALLGIVMPLMAWRVNPAVAVATGLAALLTIYGLIAVNLNWPVARSTACVGSVGLTVAGAAALNPCVLVIAACALPATLLLLAPYESRTWFDHR